ncbi:MAG: FAD-dependent oxidoreductase, partial [Pseudomonas sp.]
MRKSLRMYWNRRASALAIQASGPSHHSLEVHSMSEQPTLSADYVVIGSGICGSLLARRLAQQGASVLILEAGPRIKRDDIFKAFIDTPRK